MQQRKKPATTIDKIVRVSKHVFMIVYLERDPVLVTSTGNAEYLLEWLLEAPYGA